MKLNHKVEVVHDESGDVVKSVDCGSDMRKAQKMRDALNINLNHSEYTVFISIEGEKND